MNSPIGSSLKKKKIKNQSNRKDNAAFVKNNTAKTSISNILKFQFLI